MVMMTVVMVMMRMAVVSLCYNGLSITLTHISPKTGEFKYFFILYGRMNTKLLSEWIYTVTFLNWVNVHKLCKIFAVTQHFYGQCIVRIVE